MIRGLDLVSPSVEIETDARVESQSLPAVLTLNSQQWTSSSVEYTQNGGTGGRL